MSDVDKKMGIMYFPRKMTKKEQETVNTLLVATFDASVDDDERDLVTTKENNKQLKAYYRIKIVLYPFEWLLIRLMLGKAEAVKRMMAHRRMKAQYQELKKIC